ncbi:MAG: CPBP family intramembrane glutamic endopeptidase [bacterium]
MPFNELTLLLYLAGSMAFCWFAVFMLTLNRPAPKIEIRNPKSQLIFVISSYAFLFAAYFAIHSYSTVINKNNKDLSDLLLAGITVAAVAAAALASGGGPESAGLSFRRIETAVFFLVPPAALMFLPGHFMNWQALWRGIALPLVAAGFAEELFFRGFMQTRLESRLGNTRGLLITAAAYAVFKLPMLWGTLPAAGLIANMAGTFLIWGCAAGLIYRRSGNIYGLILLHIFWDAAPRVFLGFGIG